MHDIINLQILYFCRQMKRKPDCLIAAMMVITLTAFGQLTLAWQPASILEALSPYHQSLTHYTMSKYTKNSSEMLLIFGGITETGQKSNTLYRINIATQALQVLGGTNKPSPRSHGCSLYHNDKFYVYGGLSDGENISLLNQLLCYDLITDTWSNLSTSSAAIGMPSCTLVIYHSEINIFGPNSNNNMVICGYNYTTLTWNSKTYFYLSTLQFQTVLWDNTKVTTTLDIRNREEIRQSTNQIAVKYLKTQNLFVDQICSTDISSHFPIVYFATRESVYQINMTSLQIKWLTDLNIELNKRHQCLQNSQWLLIVLNDQTLSTIDVLYYKISDFSINGYFNQASSMNSPQISQLLSKNRISIPLLQWPISISDFNIFMDDSESLYLLSNSNLMSYKLTKNCAFPNNSKVEHCFYGQTRCRRGYVGHQCTFSQCPGSVAQEDQTDHLPIKSECSGNGVCTGQGCLCFDYWTGQDCSIYRRKLCNGVLQYNYPVMNCECRGDTTGGNDCQVQFCYNDCSQNGVCQKNGSCTCNPQFAGSDCSVLIIAFPNYQPKAYYSLLAILVVIITLLF